eukprot:s3273_g3.t1
MDQLTEVFGPLVQEQPQVMKWSATKREAEPDSAPSERSKASRTEQGKGRPWNPAPGNKQRWRKGGGKGQNTENPNITYLVKALARLALQQETAILRQDYSWVLFVQPGNQGPLPLLFAAAQKWKEAQEEGATNTALRTTLFGCHTGLKDVGGETPTPFKAEEMKWLKDGHWCYQKWSPALGSLVVDETRDLRREASTERVSGVSFCSGAYSQGPLFGLRRNTTLFPWVTLLINKYIRSGTHETYTTQSSFVLQRNTTMCAHRDINNDPDSVNVVLP